MSIMNSLFEFSEGALWGLILIPREVANIGYYKQCVKYIIKA